MTLVRWRSPVATVVPQPKRESLVAEDGSSQGRLWRRERNSSAPDIRVGLSAASGISSVDALRDALSDSSDKGFSPFVCGIPSPKGSALSTLAFLDWSTLPAFAHSSHGSASATKGENQQPRHTRSTREIENSKQPGVTRCAPAKVSGPVGLRSFPPPTRPEQQTAYHTLPWEPCLKQGRSR
jgi:hypothetical protein